MRWKAKPLPVKGMITGIKGPEIGDKKQKNRFAWLPVKIEKHIIWLESYVEVWEYKKYKVRERDDLIVIAYADEWVDCVGWRLIKKEFKKPKE